MSAGLHYAHLGVATVPVRCQNTIAAKPLEAPRFGASRSRGGEPNHGFRATVRSSLPLRRPDAG
jgi:hypothetical protein